MEKNVLEKFWWHESPSGFFINGEFFLRRYGMCDETLICVRTSGRLLFVC